MNLYQMKAPDGTIYNINPHNVTLARVHKSHSHSKGLASNASSIEIASANTVVF